jgi:hypothetical protein
VGRRLVPSCIRASVGYGKAHGGFGLLAGKFPTATGTGVGDYHFDDLARRFAAVEPPADNVAERNRS